MRPIEEAIIRATCEVYRVGRDDLVSRKRSRGVAEARLVAYYLTRTHTGASYPHLGTVFERDHSTVHHGVQTIENALRASRRVRVNVEAIRVLIADCVTACESFAVMTCDNRPIDFKEQFRLPTDRCGREGCGFTRAEHAQTEAVAA